MDLDLLRMFVKVAELGSFTRAAEHLSLSKARVSLGIQSLEAEVASQLLRRTTRAVRLTADGELFIARAQRLLAEAEELGAMFQAPRNLRGSVRIDLPVTFACNLFIPRLPEFLAAHPQLEVLVSTTDRRVDVVREGFDCVLRIGALQSSGLIARRLGVLPMVNCASPSYLQKYGTPRALEDLDRHLLVHYSLAFGADSPAFEYADGARYVERPMRSVVSVNAADAYIAACAAGLGIIQAPRTGLEESLVAGRLVEVLPKHTAQPMPVSLVHAHVRSVPKRVRAIVSWLEQLILPRLAQTRAP